MSLESYLRAAPKAELHLHLEGSIQPVTLLELARRNGVSLPYETLDGLKEWFVFRDFAHFIQVYIAVSRCLKTAADYELIVYEMGRELARQHVRYAEVTFSPSTHELIQGVPHDRYFAGLVRGRARVRAELGVQINWVFDIVRNTARLDGAHADYTTREAIEGMGEGVVALGLGGSEAGHPPELFGRWFDQARAAGLRSAPHAGETVGAQSVWGALRVLGADRIGHGARSIDDPALIEHLAAQGIAVELCPTSNVRLGIYPSLAAHPLRRIWEAGVPVTVNSDDPALFSTTINDEYASLAGPLGFGAGDVAALDQIILNGVRHSFLPLEQKQALAQSFTTELAALRLIHLAV